MNKNIVVSAFPACGKSTLYKNGFEGYSVFDSDSSYWDKSQFPNNYITHIKALMRGTGNKIILVSSHDVVREALYNEGIEYLLVYPSLEMKDEYIQRYIDRGNTTNFVELLNNNWETFINSCINDKNCNHMVMKSGEYLTDVLKRTWAVN